MKKSKSSMKRYATMKTYLTGGIIAVLLGSTLLTTTIQKKAESETAKATTSELSRGIQANLTAHEVDMDKFLITSMDSALQRGYNYSLMLGNTLTNKTTNDDLLAVSKKYGFTAATVFSITKEGVSGIQSTQPNRIGYTLQATGTEKDITDFLIKTKQSEQPVLSDTLRTYNTSVITDAYQVRNDYFFDVYTYVRDKDKVLALTIPAQDMTDFLGTQSTNTLIETLKTQYPQIVEVGVIDAPVKQSETESHPKDGSSTDEKPLELTLLSGTAKYVSSSDTDLILTNKLESEGSRYLQEVNGKQLFKSFTPISGGKVVYIGLDFTAITSETPTKVMTSLVTSGVVILLVLSLLTWHFRRETAKHIQIEKRLNTLATGRYNLKTLTPSTDEYYTIILYLEALTTELASTKSNTEYVLQSLRDLSDMLSNGEVTNEQDLEDFRVALRALLNDLEVAIKTTID